jgi:hypothetical protein
VETPVAYRHPLKVCEMYSNASKINNLVEQMALNRRATTQTGQNNYSVQSMPRFNGRAVRSYTRWRGPSDRDAAEELGPSQSPQSTRCSIENQLMEVALFKYRCGCGAGLNLRATFGGRPFSRRGVLRAAAVVQRGRVAGIYRKVHPAIR